MTRSFWLRDLPWMLIGWSIATWQHEGLSWLTTTTFAACALVLLGRPQRDGRGA